MDVSKVGEQLNDFLTKVDTVLLKYSVVKTLKEKGVRPAWLFIALVSFLFLFLFYGVGGPTLCNLVGFIYPVYASLKALKTKDADSEDDRQWLTYWIVYAFFCVFEDFTDFLSDFIPFYHLLKLSFLVWCFMPQTRGAQTVYELVIKRVFDQYEGSIDGSISELSMTAQEISSAASKAMKGDASKKSE